MADQEIALTEFEVQAQMRFRLDARKVVSNLQPEEVLDLIREMDDEVGLWAATILLFRYFEAQMSLARTHAPDLVEMTDEQLLLELHGEMDEQELIAIGRGDSQEGGPNG